MNLLIDCICFVILCIFIQKKKFNQKMSSYSKFNNNINVLQRIFKKQNVKQHSVCQALVSVYSLLSTKGVKGKKGVHHQKAHKGKKSFVLRLIYCFNYILRPQKRNQNLCSYVCTSILISLLFFHFRYEYNYHNFGICQKFISTI